LLSSDGALAIDLETRMRRTTMSKIALIGIAAVAATVFAGPAFAQHRAGHGPAIYTQANACGYQEPGNPYSKEEDYLAWSAWRARGGWDDRVDPNCVPNRFGRLGF
jgi:hypothetical protein